MKTNIKLNVLSLIILLCSTGIMAQTYTIKGKIIDKDSKEDLMFVNTVLFSKKDTTKQIMGTASDTNGVFALKGVKKQDLVLTLTFIGYHKKNIEISSSMFKNEILDLKNIEMDIAGEGLQEVEIVAQKDRIKLDADKMTMTIDINTAQSVTNVFELLKKAPGIAIDKDDNLKLNGKQGILIQFQGRDMKLPWKSMVQILKGIPATQIDKFEIIANPSSKYDAEGVAGIINILFKQDKNHGLNASLGLNSYYSGASSNMGDININYVDDKWTSTLSFSASNWRQKMEQENIMKTGFGKDTIYNKSNSDMLYSSWDYNLNMGTNYQINNKNSIGINFTYSKNQLPNRENPTKTLISTLINNVYKDSLKFDGLSTTSNNANNYIINANYQHKFDTLGQNISVDFDLVLNNSNNISKTMTKYFNLISAPLLPYKIENLDNTTKSFYHSYIFRTDYFKPFTKTLSMELGAKSSITKVDNDFSALLNGINDAGKSNHFIYDENVNALYLSFKKSFGEKTSLRLGVRGENTNIKGNQTFYKDSVFVQEYTDFFPNLSLSHAFSDKNNFTFAYSMRISRPSYDNLNPFLSKDNDYSFSKGNPKLKPEYTHNFSLQHSFMYMIFTSLTYSYTKDVVSQIPMPLPNSPIIYTTHDNINYFHNLNLSISTAIPITQWLTNVLYLSGNYSDTKSNIQNIDYANKMFSFMGYFSESFSLPKKYKIDLSGYYTSGGNYGIFHYKDFYGMNINASKTFFKDMLTLSVGVNNLFTRNEAVAGFEMGNTYAEGKHKGNFTMITAGIRLNIGQRFDTDKLNRKDAFDQRATGKQDSGVGQGVIKGM